MAGSWESDGPELPLEFARQSKNKRVTLVICSEGTLCRTLWAPLRVGSVSEAVEELRVREGTVGKHIGFWSPTEASDHPCRDVVAAWAEANDLSGVVWTALPPKFDDRDVAPSEAELLSYLKCLDAESRERAEEYVRRAPQQIQTAYRLVMERELAWTSLASK